MYRILYQFPLSHYCEKARWMMDFKHLEYEVRNLFPGAHRLLSWWRAHSSTVPLLKDGKEWIGDSTEMAFWLDARYPQNPLLPNDPLKRSKVAMLEEIAVAFPPAALGQLQPGASTGRYRRLRWQALAGTNAA